MPTIRVDAPIAPIEEPVSPEADGLTIYQLRNGVCHWPDGGFRGKPPFMYCGRKSLPERPYCEKHTRMAHGGRMERA